MRKNLALFVRGRVPVLLVISLVLASIAYAATKIDDGVLDSGLEEHGRLHQQHGGSDGHLPFSK